MRHVPGGINVNEPADAGDHQQHDHRSWSICRSKPARKLPATIQVKNSLWKVDSGRESKNSRTASSAARNDNPVEPSATRVDDLVGPLRAEKSVDGRAKQRQQRNNPQIVQSMGIRV